MENMTHWESSPVWENSGNTTTRQQQIYTSWAFMAEPIPVKS
jgi:hypothetical protein